MAHVHCMLDTKGYKYTLVICDTYCFSAETMVARTRLNVTSMCALSCFLLPCVRRGLSMVYSSIFLSWYHKTFTIEESTARIRVERREELILVTLLRPQKEVSWIYHLSIFAELLRFPLHHTPLYSSAVILPCCLHKCW